jgi:hypothetical protein
MQLRNSKLKGELASNPTGTRKATKGPLASLEQHAAMANQLRTWAGSEMDAGKQSKLNQLAEMHDSLSKGLTGL